MCRIIGIAASARERALAERKLWASTVEAHRGELSDLAAQLLDGCPGGPEVEVNLGSGCLAEQLTITLMFGSVRVIAQREDGKPIVHHPASATLELQANGSIAFQFYAAQKRAPDMPFSETPELVESVLPSAIDASWLLRCMETFVHKAVASDWPAPVLLREVDGRSASLLPGPESR